MYNIRSLVKEYMKGQNNPDLYHKFENFLCWIINHKQLINMTKEEIEKIIHDYIKKHLRITVEKDDFRDYRRYIRIYLDEEYITAYPLI